MFGTSELIDSETTTLTKRERKLLRRKGLLPPPEQKHGRQSLGNMTLKPISPLTDNQRRTFEAYRSGKNLMLTGTAGTGKTFLSLYLGMSTIQENDYEQTLTIVRSVVPSRDMGFLPGSNQDKIKVYESPYSSIYSELYSRGDAYSILKTKGIVNFISTSFIRGTTINDSIIVIDEIQNMNAGELHTIFTRIGKNCRVIFSGDIKQTDLNGRYDKSGFIDFFKVLEKMRGFASIEFDKNDIVRSSIVKDYIIARESLEERGIISPLI